MKYVCLRIRVVPGWVTPVRPASGYCDSLSVDTCGAASPLIVALSVMTTLELLSELLDIRHAVDEAVQPVSEVRVRFLDAECIELFCQSRIAVCAILLHLPHGVLEKAEGALFFQRL